MSNFKLSDGTVISTATSKSNRTGYTGSALWPSFSNKLDKPFVAACSNPKDPRIMRQLRCQQRTSLHGGQYADAREAAYVVARFKADPIGTDAIIGKLKAFKQFPADLYSLPKGLSRNQAIQTIKKSSVAKKVKTTKLVIPSEFKIKSATISSDKKTLKIELELA